MDHVLSFMGFITIIPLIVFVVYLGKHLHKNEYIYYFVASVIAFVALVLGILEQAGVLGLALADIPVVYQLIFQGHLTFALFVLVMFAGAFKNKTPQKITLMRVRREMAILGFLFLVPHAAFLIVTALSAWNPTGTLAFLIMVPLFVTSFPKIRKKLKPLQWRKLHKWAYAAYAFIYAHLLTINLIAQQDTGNLRFIRFALYTVIFLFYTYLKFKNYILPAHRKKNPQKA